MSFNVMYLNGLLTSTVVSSVAIAGLLVTVNSLLIFLPLLGALR
jgi:hypothetical protein